MFGKKNQEQDYEGQIVDPRSLPTQPGDPTLIVDLPDGQKLIVGQLEPGTIIEVATWRGTGRPDSRTNRLLLGAGVNEDARQKAISAPKSDKNDSVFSGEPEAREPANQLVSPRKELVKGKHGVARNKTVYSKLGYVAAGIVALIAIPTMVASNGLFEISSPDMGMGTKLGGARSVVAITTEVDEPQSGDVVLAQIESNGVSQELLAKVTAVGGDKVLLQANGIQYEVPASSVTSEVRVVVPFIGSIAKVFGA
jgi:hypothetical protein